jgi:non-specific serine/threonine protein kinase
MGLSLISKNSPNSTGQKNSMRALMDWSFERLTELEQMVYCRASIFSGPFHATALSAVYSDFLSFEGVTDMAVHLARKSLLEIDVDATPTQYVMMKTVREYGREQLQTQPDFSRPSSSRTSWLQIFSSAAVTPVSSFRTKSHCGARQPETRQTAIAGKSSSR